MFSSYINISAVFGESGKRIPIEYYRKVDEYLTKNNLSLDGFVNMDTNLEGGLI